MEEIVRPAEPTTREGAKKAAITLEARYEQKKTLLLEWARLKQSMEAVQGSIERNELILSNYLEQFPVEDRELERALLESEQ